MGRRGRATMAGAADRHAVELSTRLGAGLRDARVRSGLTQAQAAVRAGLAQTTWSKLEVDRDPRFTVATWDRAAHAVGTTLNAYLPRASAAGVPRDAVQLKAQELVLRLAKRGGWDGAVEERLDSEASTSRFGDVVLRRPWKRPREVALMEVIDWFEDVGAPMRAWQRRLEALERRQIARMLGDDDVPRIRGCWIVRATRRNRGLLTAHANVFRGRFPGSGRAWLEAIQQPEKPMPQQPALLWMSVDGTRLFAARLGS